MKVCIFLFLTIAFLGLEAQPPWEHTDLSSETSEYIDAVQGITGHWLLAGSEYNCYLPVISILNEDGKLIRQKHIEIGSTWYGRPNRVFAMSDGNFAIVSWGALAHDVGGSNGFFTIVDTTLNIVYIDSVESYQGYSPPSSIYSSTGWQKGDTVAALYRNHGDTLLLRKYDGIQHQLIRKDTFLIDKPSQGITQWDRGLTTFPWRDDTLFIALGNKLGKYHTGNLLPMKSVNTTQGILALQGTAYGLLVLTENSLLWFSNDLQLYHQYTWPYEAYSGFLTNWQDSVTVGITKPDSRTLIYRINADTALQQLMVATNPDMLWLNGVAEDDSTLVLVGRNWLKASAVQADLKGNRNYEPFDIAIEGITYSSTLTDSFLWQPGTMAFRYQLDVDVTVRNRSTEILDSFAVQYLYPGLFQFDCPVFTEGETKRERLMPNESKITHLSWIIVSPYYPDKLNMCFKAYAPNGTIDEPKVDNTFCLLVKITGVKEAIKKLPIKVWAKQEGKRILIELPHEGALSFSVFNMAGQKIMERGLSGGLNELHYDLPPGIYAWRIYNSKDGSTVSDKIILY